MTTPIDIQGTVEGVIFRAEDGPFAIASIRTDDGTVTCKGSMSGIREGADVDIRGTWTTHEDYGKQIDVTAFAQEMPQSREGIARWLTRVEGVGDAYADALATHILKKPDSATPEYIESCDEVPDAASKAAAEAWANNRAMRKTLVALQGIGLTSSQADKAFERWGAEAASIVEENPYRICDLDRVGFATADRLAREQFDIEHTDPRRLKEGVLYALKQQQKQNQHVGLPETTLVQEAADALDVNRSTVIKPVEWMVDDSRMVRRHGLVFSATDDESEQSTADRLRVIDAGESATFDTDDEDTETLTDEQSDALRATLEEGGIVTVTGGPGTGKTYTLKSIVAAWKKRNEAREVACEFCEGSGTDDEDPCSECKGTGKQIEGEGAPVYLAAPTGRAAKRMANVAGAGAQTIHRLLECRPTSSGFTWGRDLGELDGLIIIDEASMLDTRLAATLLRRINTSSTVVFVGDADQLPSVGPGYVLHDIIKSDVGTSVELTKIHRQAQGSGIVRFAYDVQQGTSSPTTKNTDDFYAIECPSAQRAHEMILACYERLIDQGFDPTSDIQIVTPMKADTPSCAQALNNDVQNLLFDGGTPCVEIGSRRYFKGGRVMQIVNDYDHNVFNGDVGQIVSAYPGATGKTACLVVDFQGREVKYTRSRAAKQLRRAYACTIHKSQGCEYPVVIVAITQKHYYMLERTLLYTAVTRAEDRAVVVYEPNALSKAIDHNPPQQRHRALTERLEDV